MWVGGSYRSKYFKEGKEEERGDLEKVTDQIILKSKKR